MRFLTLAFALAITGCGGDKDSDGNTNDDAVDTDDTDLPGDDDDDTTETSDTGTPPFPVPEPVGDPATVDLGGECPLANDYGGFVVEILNTELLEYSVVSGSIANGVVPVTNLEQVGVDGDCTLNKRNNPFCDPPCSAGETCDFDGSCIPFPDNQDLGMVTVGGLEVDVAMAPVQPGFQYFDTQVPHPVFQPSELIEVRSWKSTFGDDFTMHGVGVEALDLAGETNWVIVDGADMTVTWTPPTATPNRAHVHLRLNIDQHGNTPVQLFCEFDDTGTGVVPASLISQLVSFGVTGFPNATLTRRTVDQTTVEGGCIDFKVNSPAEPSVLVDGFIPCNGDLDCPPGEICDTVTFICHP